MKIAKKSEPLYFLSLCIFVFLILILTISCNENSSDNATEETAEVRIAVSVQTMTHSTIRDYINVNAEIHAAAMVDVFAEAAGELTKLTAAVGDRVNKGDIIGEVDPSRAGQRFAPSPIRAPISGTFIHVTPRIGSQIAPQTPIARIATTEQLEIKAQIPERFVGRLTQGVRAIVSLNAFPSQEFSARLTQLSPTVDPQSRTLETSFRFDRRDSRIRPGMFAQLQVILEERSNAYVIPQSAIIRRDGTSYIYVMNEDNRASRRDVRIGLEIDGQAEILEGLAIGEQVIVRGQNLLSEGTLLRVVGEQ